MSIITHDPSRFVAALLTPGAPPPSELLDAEANGRFEIYRSNVVSGLVRALAVRFPATERLVGGAFFSATAQAFIRAKPPTSPLLMTYGEAFPAFLRRYAPAADLPYLPDVAALEVARGKAYHAADAEALDTAAFAALPAERIGSLRLMLHPSVILLRSPHPAVTIWEAQQHEAAPMPNGGWEAEDALVHRRGAVVAVTRLEPGQAAFLAALQAVATLEDAAAAAFGEADAFDPQRAFALVIGEGLVTALVGS